MNKGLMDAYLLGLEKKWLLVRDTCASNSTIKFIALEKKEEAKLVEDAKSYKMQSRTVESHKIPQRPSMPWAHP